MAFLYLAFSLLSSHITHLTCPRLHAAYIYSTLRATALCSRAYASCLRFVLCSHAYATCYARVIRCSSCLHRCGRTAAASPRPLIHSKKNRIRFCRIRSTTPGRLDVAYLRRECATALLRPLRVGAQVVERFLANELVKERCWLTGAKENRVARELAVSDGSTERVLCHVTVPPIHEFLNNS